MCMGKQFMQDKVYEDALCKEQGNVLMNNTLCERN